jgi:hypothetical protein
MPEAKNIRCGLAQVEHMAVHCPHGVDAPPSGDMIGEFRPRQSSTHSGNIIYGDCCPGNQGLQIIHPAAQRRLGRDY